MGGLQRLHKICPKLLGKIYVKIMLFWLDNLPQKLKILMIFLSHMFLYENIWKKKDIEVLYLWEYQCLQNSILKCDWHGQRCIFMIIGMKQFLLMKLLLISLEIKSVDGIKMVIDLSDDYQNFVKRLWHGKEFYKGEKHPYFIL